MEADACFEVFVCVFNEEVITLNVSPWTTIEKLMTEGLHKDFDDHLLLFRGQNLLNDRLTTLQDWGIKTLDQLILSRKGLFDVIVHTEQGHTSAIVIKVETLETVFQTKKKISEVTRVPIADQLLYYCNNPMDRDNVTLATYGIFHPGDQGDTYVLDMYITGFDKLPLTNALEFISGHLEQLSPAKGSYTGFTIFIEIAAEYSPDVAGTTSTFILHLVVKGKDTVDMVKSMIIDWVRSHKGGSPLNYILEGQFVLVFKRKLMVDLWTLHECDIKNQDTVVLCRKQDFPITVLVVLADESSEVQVHGVRVRSFDNVMKLKITVKELAGISSEKNVVLRCGETWLADDHKCLFEYGLVELKAGRGTVIVEAVEYDAGQERQLD